MTRKDEIDIINLKHKFIDNMMKYYMFKIEGIDELNIMLEENVRIITLYEEFFQKNYKGTEKYRNRKQRLNKIINKNEKEN